MAIISWERHAKVALGYGTLIQMLEIIGSEGADDHAIAKLLVENEMSVRWMARFVIEHLQKEAN